MAEKLVKISVRIPEKLLRKLEVLRDNGCVASVNEAIRTGAAIAALLYGRCEDD